MGSFILHFIALGCHVGPPSPFLFFFFLLFFFLPSLRNSLFGLVRVDMIKSISSTALFLLVVCWGPATCFGDGGPNPITGYLPALFFLFLNWDHKSLYSVQPNVMLYCSRGTSAVFNGHCDEGAPSRLYPTHWFFLSGTNQLWLAQDAEPK